MLQAATWFVQKELQKVADMVKERPGYELLLVGHSLGAGQWLCFRALSASVTCHTL